MDTTPKTFTPRQWQSDMLVTFSDWYFTREAGSSRSFTAAVTGGAGKTHAGAMIVDSLLSGKNFKNVLVIAPSNVIAGQWFEALNAHGIQTAIWESDMDYYVVKNFITTYSMMALYPERFAKMMKAGSILIFDECHHLADSRSWGDASKIVGKNAGIRLMLTGTPFREDEAAIPFVTYKNGRLVTNFSYTYGQALEDGYVRAVYFRAFDGEASWKFDDDIYSGEFKQFNSSLSETMRTLIAPNGNWLRKVIEHAHEQLTAFRKSVPNAAGIITCADQTHAQEVHRLVQQITHSNPVIAISDDADSDAKIERFRTSSDQWLVVVRKGGEGLDIPRLRIGVWATNITKQLSFLQFLWRIVRDEGSMRDGEHAYFYMPSHPLLLSFASTLREQRLHVIAPDALNRPSVLSPSDEKPSIRIESTFAAISAEAGEMTEFRIGESSMKDPLKLLREVAEVANRAMFNIAQNCSEGNKEVSQIYAANQLEQIAAMLAFVQPKEPAVAAVSERAEERKTAHGERLFKHQQKLWQKTLDKVRNLTRLHKDALLIVLYGDGTNRSWNRADVARRIGCAEGSVRMRELADTGLVRASKMWQGEYHNNLAEHIKNYPAMINHDFMADIAKAAEGGR